MTRPITMSIDPGKGSGGLAWCLGRGKIEHSGIVTGLDPQKLALDLRHVLHAWPQGREHGEVQVWPEYMVIRGGQSQNTMMAKAKACLDLQFISGALCGALIALLPGATIRPVTYHEWSGSASENTVRNRLIGDGTGSGVLHAQEVCALDVKRYPAGLRHNLYDAAGIFMFATGRMRPGGYA